MSKLERRGKVSGFEQIYPWADDLPISDAAFRLWVKLRFAYRGGYGDNMIPHEVLAEQMRCSPRSISRYLKELQAYGLAGIDKPEDGKHPRTDGGNFAVTTFWVWVGEDKPLTPAEIQSMELQEDLPGIDVEELDRRTPVSDGGTTPLSDGGKTPVSDASIERALPSGSITEINPPDPPPLGDRKGPAKAGGPGTLDVKRPPPGFSRHCDDSTDLAEEIAELEAAGPFKEVAVHVVKDLLRGFVPEVGMNKIVEGARRYKAFAEAEGRDRVQSMANWLRERGWENKYTLPAQGKVRTGRRGGNRGVVDLAAELLEGMGGARPTANES